MRQSSPQKSPPKSASSPSKPSSAPFVTRYGVSTSPEPHFGNEERFSWQKAQFVSDVVYQLPDAKEKRGVMFGTSARGGMDDLNPDAKKRSTGPGSYHIESCYNSISEYPHHAAYRFGAAARQSMDMKTPSPGAIYNTTELFKNGKDRNIKISFNRDNRMPLNGQPAGVNADMLWPKLPKGTSVTIGKRLKYKSMGADTPGAIYDVHKVVGFKTGPSFSFGKSKASRFKNTLEDLTLGPP
jgi:hypothetical protein